MRVLLVEDNRMNVELFTDSLEIDGHAVTTAPDADAALRLVADETFDVILLDIQLPGRDGAALCRELRAAGLVVPILAVSSAALPEQVASAMTAGFDEYLTKPISPAVLRGAVKRHAEAAARR